MALLILLMILVVALLAVASWSVAPRVNRDAWQRGRPGSIWFHDPRGDVIQEDDEFKRPPNENELL